MPHFPARNPAQRLPRLTATLAVLATLLALAGCATTRAGDPPREKNPDPWEGFNRGVFRFNDVLDRNVLRPVAVAYHNHTPKWLQTGVGNFFQNLSTPTTILHQVLQGKPREAAQDTSRFLINTTLGWGGVLDVASGANLPVHNEDSGQTLGRWGVPPGPYLVLPFLGPATVRDAPARVADDFTQPFRWYNADNERWFSLALSLVDTRARLLPLDRTLRETYDPYAFVRDAFLQRRRYAVFDGNPPEDPIDDDWAEEAMREEEAAAAAAGGSPATEGSIETADPEATSPAPEDGTPPGQ